MSRPSPVPRIELTVGPDLPTLVIQAPSVIVTSLSPGDGTTPTLISVERIVGELAGYDRILNDPAETERIAALVNKHFLQRPQAQWGDCHLSLNTLPKTLEMAPAFTAVQAVRDATLESANAILHERHYGDAASIHRSEDELVTQVGQAAQANRQAFTARTTWVPKLIARTALSALVAGLVGIPLDVILRSALGGFLGRVGP